MNLISSLSASVESPAVTAKNEIFSDDPSLIPVSPMAIIAVSAIPAEDQSFNIDLDGAPPGTDDDTHHFDVPGTIEFHHANIEGGLRVGNEAHSERALGNDSYLDLTTVSEPRYML